MIQADEMQKRGRSDTFFLIVMTRKGLEYML